MSSSTIQMCDTLRILHLPSYLSNDQRNVLLQKYGATKVRTLRLASKYTVTFAKFSSQQLAAEALLRLHQLNVEGQRLSVEYAKKSIPMELSELEPEREAPTKSDTTKNINKSELYAFMRKLNSWTMNHMFSQLPLPNIKYKYVAPTKDILIRIAIQLLKEPAFYTQVLHLMNKMNLPPPFKELETEFPMLREMYNIEKHRDIFDNDITSTDKMSETLYEHVNKEIEEEEESEIESDREDDARPPEIIPVKRKRQQSTRRLKIPKFAKLVQNTATSSTQKVLKPEDMFESVQLEETKSLKIELKTLDKSLNEISANDNLPVDGGFGLIFPTNKASEDVKDNDENVGTQKNKFITTEELEANRISVNDRRLLPVFKHYHAGKPSNRLYIKNLAKQVETSDLHYIYQRYIITVLKDADNEYNIRLMQEGRMKGQAFVTLQNVAQAQLALEETNGYILKDKPIVVQFAKAVKS